MLVAMVGLALPLVGASCAKFSGDEQPPADAAAGDTAARGLDASVPDTDVAADAPLEAVVDASVAADAGVVTLMSDDFEFSCGAWNGLNGTIRSIGPGNTGTKACELCAGGDTGIFTRTVALAPRQNGEVLMHAFARLTTAPGPVEVRTVLTCRDETGERVVADKVADADLTAQYMQLENTTAFLAPVKAPTTIQVNFEIPPSTCALFDDISLSFKAK